MKLVTANRLGDGRVIYLGADQAPVGDIAAAILVDDGQAEAALAAAAARPDIFVNPYLVEVDRHAPSGRDRLKERIRSAGPTVGHSLDRGLWRETA